MCYYIIVRNNNTQPTIVEYRKKVFIMTKEMKKVTKAAQETFIRAYGFGPSLKSINVLGFYEVDINSETHVHIYLTVDNSAVYYMYNRSCKTIFIDRVLIDREYPEVAKDFINMMTGPVYDAINDNYFYNDAVIAAQNSIYENFKFKYLMRGVIEAMKQTIDRKLVGVTNKKNHESNLQYLRDIHTAYDSSEISKIVDDDHMEINVEKVYDMLSGGTVESRHFVKTHLSKTICEYLKCDSIGDIECFLPLYNYPNIDDNSRIGIHSFVFSAKYIDGNIECRDDYLAYCVNSRCAAQNDVYRIVKLTGATVGHVFRRLCREPLAPYCTRWIGKNAKKLRDQNKDLIDTGFVRDYMDSIVKRCENGERV